MRKPKTPMGTHLHLYLECKKGSTKSKMFKKEMARMCATVASYDQPVKG